MGCSESKEAPPPASSVSGQAPPASVARTAAPAQTHQASATYSYACAPASAPAPPREPLPDPGAEPSPFESVPESRREQLEREIAERICGGPVSGSGLRYHGTAQPQKKPSPRPMTAAELAEEERKEAQRRQRFESQVAAAPDQIQAELARIEAEKATFEERERARAEAAAAQRVEAELQAARMEHSQHQAAAEQLRLEREKLLQELAELKGVAPVALEGARTPRRSSDKNTPPGSRDNLEHVQGRLARAKADRLRLDEAVSGLAQEVEEERRRSGLSTLSPATQSPPQSGRGRGAPQARGARGPAARTGPRQR
eukprot:TRINITY_DN8767_c0_g1_i1.p1 TRINITY_DN8767_c0_g1~~TRINITY_DN8767_c0_g1_i1.p1  ORF type:complete len:314 (+),score=71.27 TRINITY_DN8767_c0_g1_i1:109-1050(+)